MASDAPIVDAHFHLYTTDMPLTDTAWHRPQADAGVEQALATMDAHGVTFGVVSAASINGDYNDYVLRALRANRRLRATANVQPDSDIFYLERLKAEGFVGIRLLWRPLEVSPDIASGPWRLLLRRCADLDLHVHLTDKPQRIGTTIAAIEAAGARVVLDHMGLIDTDLDNADPGFRQILAAIERGRTWVKLSGGFRFSSPQKADAMARDLVLAAGGDRLVWGSDWPFAGFADRTSYAQTLDDLERWVPDAGMRRRIGGETPLQFYFT